MTRRARPFTIADAMALIAATAVGLVLFRTAAFATTDNLVLQRPQDRVAPYVFAVSIGLAPMALAWSIALLGLGLRSPRPPLRRLMREPGFAGCVAAAVTTEVVALSWAMAAMLRLTTDPLSSGGSVRDAGMRCLSLIPAIGSAVAASWAIVSAGGRRRVPATWVEIAGRWGSGYFVAILPMYYVAFAR